MKKMLGKIAFALLTALCITLLLFGAGIGILFGLTGEIPQIEGLAAILVGAAFVGWGVVIWGWEKF